jgi:hypothetical protein
MRTTNLYVIINDETLQTVWGVNSEGHSAVAKFHSEGEADTFASTFLESWSVVHIHFIHKHIHHIPWA